MRRVEVESKARRYPGEAQKQSGRIGSTGEGDDYPVWTDPVWTDPVWTGPIASVAPSGGLEKFFQGHVDGFARLAGVGDGGGEGT